MQRRYFEHLYREISVAAGRRISRYDLWLQIWDSGGDPDDLTAHHVRRFVDRSLDAVLIDEGVAVTPRMRHRLEKRLVGFDPRYPTPEEHFAVFGEARASAD